MLPAYLVWMSAYLVASGELAVKHFIASLQPGRAATQLYFLLV